MFLKVFLFGIMASFSLAGNCMIFFGAFLICISPVAKALFQCNVLSASSEVMYLYINIIYFSSVAT